MSFFLELSIRPIEFAAASSVNAVFFDETNSEVISVNNDAEISITSQRIGLFFNTLILYLFWEGLSLAWEKYKIP
jgi:hypothetical protein